MWLVDVDLGGGTVFIYLILAVLVGVFICWVVIVNERLSSVAGRFSSVVVGEKSSSGPCTPNCGETL